mgnify:CR=1 FL=1
MTGDRFGYITFANDEWADVMVSAWNNMTAGLPAEWQLRYTAMVGWLDEHPEIQQKIKALYDLRRDHLREAIERRERAGGAVLQYQRKPGNPVGALAVDQVADDVEW